MESYSADAVKRRKRREPEDLGNYELPLIAEWLVTEAYSQLVQSAFDFDLDIYEYGIELLGQAISVYEQIKYTAAVQGVKRIIKVLSSVFNFSEERDRRDLEAFEKLKQLFGRSRRRLKPRDRALVIGFTPEEILRFKQFYSLYPLELLNCSSIEAALKVIDDTHERLAVIVIDAVSFPEGALRFYKDHRNQKRFAHVKIARYPFK